MASLLMPGMQDPDRIQSFEGLTYLLSGTLKIFSFTFHVL